MLEYVDGREPSVMQETLLALADAAELTILPRTQTKNGVSILWCTT